MFQEKIKGGKRKDKRVVKRSCFRSRERKRSCILIERITIVVNWEENKSCQEEKKQEFLK